MQPFPAIGRFRVVISRYAGYADHGLQIRKQSVKVRTEPSLQAFADPFFMIGHSPCVVRFTPSYSLGKNCMVVGGNALKYAVTTGFSSLRIFFRH